MSADPPLDFNLNTVKHENIYNAQKCIQHPYFSNSIFCMDNHRGHHTSNWETFTCERVVLEPYICTLCQFTTHLKTCFNEHVEKIHRSSVIEDVNFNLKLYTCSDCPFQTFSSIIWLKFHGNFCYINEEKELLGDSPKRFECSQCNYKGKWRHEIRRHILNMHTREEDIDWFQCDVCPYKAKKKGNWRRHITTQHLADEFVNWFRCNFCAFKSKQRRGVRRHIRNKHEPKTAQLPLDRPLECDKCAYKAKTLFRLEKHIVRKHETVRWFECDKCDYKSKKSDNLKRHNNSQHVADEYAKWFRCDQCDFTTKHPDGVRRHVRHRHATKIKQEMNTNREIPEKILEEERQFQCDKCEYKSKTLATLKQHESNVHAADPKWLLCDKCAYKTKKGTNLKRHINSQHLTDEYARWFYCHYCEFRTRHPENVKKHLKNKHEKVNQVVFNGSPFVVD